MKLHPSRYLNDGKLYNRGQPATLIEIESAADVDELVATMSAERYYDAGYFKTHSGLAEQTKVPHFWAVSEMVRALSAKRVLDVGCGRGDVISLLRAKGLDVCGIDGSPDIRDYCWPNVRDSMLSGDLVEVSASLKRGAAFDTICGFDIWEHLHPAQLDEATDAVVELGSHDALFFFVIPAFGQDRVFGEQFPLEFEENRPEFERRAPFRFLLAERVTPPIPASGHLTWAHSEWWERHFEGHGLIRMTELESALHAVFDEYLPHSVRSFFIFGKSIDAATARCARWASQNAALERARLTLRLASDALIGNVKVRGEADQIALTLARARVPPEFLRLLKRIRGGLRSRRSGS